jgi:hypothetical protein
MSSKFQVGPVRILCGNKDRLTHLPAHDRWNPLAHQLSAKHLVYGKPCSYTLFTSPTSFNKGLSLHYGAHILAGAPALPRRTLSHRVFANSPFVGASRWLLSCIAVNYSQQVTT